MLGLNGTSAEDFPPEQRYLCQWVTATNRHGEIIVMGYRVRDMNTFCGDTVFQHESKDVCMKMAKLLNEEG